MSEEPFDPAAVILTQVAMAEGLAAACALSKVAVDAVPTPIGAAAVCRQTGPGEPEHAAEAISRVLKNTRVILISQRDGQMTAAQWSSGVKGQALSPALMLDGAPPEVEQLLLGGLTVADLPGVVTSVGMSKLRAMRILASAARATRRG